jgi:hypothetical protein
MLSSTLSFLCEPQPTPPPVYVRPPPRATYHAPPPAYFPCCHCSGHASPPAQYPQHHDNHHYGVRHKPVEQYPMMVVASEELAYVDHMQRQLALLQESVRKLSVPPSSASAKKATRQTLTAAAAQAALVIEAVTNGSSHQHHAHGSGGSSSSLPVSTLFKTIRKQRAQPRHHCCECGQTDTTQWRNSPTGKKICNPCGMRLWRSRKRKEMLSGEDSAADVIDSNATPSAKKATEQSQPAEASPGNTNTNSDEETGRRSNIYNLLN